MRNEKNENLRRILQWMDEFDEMVEEWTDEEWEEYEKQLREFAATMPRELFG